MLFFGLGAAVKKTKKQEILERVKKVQLIMEAVRVHRENRDSAYISKGGYAKPEKEGLNEGIIDKLGELRHKMRSGKSRMQGRGRSFFRGR